ncbi:MAG: hypothetical protein ACHQ49_03320 [Elusimicrobiota bacterium]
MNRRERPWSARWEAFARKHPIVCFFLILVLAFLTGPLMIAANNMTAVLYKDF